MNKLKGWVKWPWANMGVLENFVTNNSNDLRRCVRHPLDVDVIDWRYIPQSSPKSLIYFYCWYPQGSGFNALSSPRAFLRVFYSWRLWTCFKVCSETVFRSTFPSFHTGGRLTSSTVSQPFVAFGAHVGLRYVLGSETPVRVFKTLILLIHNWLNSLVELNCGSAQLHIRWGHLLIFHSQALI